MSRVLYRFIAALARLAVRSGRAKDLEIIVLRHQLDVLRRQKSRATFTDDDRTLLGAIAAALPRPGRHTVWQILRDNDIDPAPHRAEISWSEFLHSQAAVACDFFTIDTALLHRFYVLFFIHIPTRQVFFGGVTANPTGA